MTNGPSPLRVAIACGGTGGHLFPGCAIADELGSRHCEVQLLISKKDVDQQAVAGLNQAEVVTLPAIGLQAGRRWAFLKAFLQSRLQAARLFRDNPPDAVLAMGGFTSAPPILAGHAAGAATFLHESNVIPGRANRWLAHWVNECFVGFPEAADRLWNPRVTRTGTPVREAFRPMPAAAARTALGLDPRKPVLLVMGGSQGARGINEAFQKALPSLAAGHPELQFVHLTGTEGLEPGRTAAERFGRRAVTRPFLSEMEMALAAATVVVSRAGASSLAELAAMRVPSILVPYPAATDDHQTANAMAYARSGAAVLLRQSDCGPERLTFEILKLLTNPVRRESMMTALDGWKSPDAAGQIADRLITMIPVYGRTKPRKHSRGNKPLTMAGPAKAAEIA